jgi:hypothetical protein
MSALEDLHPDLQELVGTVVHERYRVDGLLGRGGMGAVFKGHHIGLRRDVAIKVLRPELGRDPSTGKRFDREAHSVSRLDHPNCVRVSDFGTTEGGVKYLVMELLEGAELEASLGQPWEPLRAVDSIIQILEGLEHAHHFGIVHRDLKPENVFVTTDFRGREVIKLVDFGIAKLIDDEGAKEQLTRAGMVFGTPRYMSPEQASGGKLDERTDLYATGLILYEMLTGHPPFVADDAALLLRMHILAPPPELPGEVPEALAAVVTKLLEKSRNDRYASAREVIEALTALRPGLEGATPASVAPGGPETGHVATPSMATHAERAGTSAEAVLPAPPASAGASSAWQPAAAAPPPAPAVPAPPPPASGASGQRFAAAAAAAPLARPPGLTGFDAPGAAAVSAAPSQPAAPAQPAAPPAQPTHAQVPVHATAPNAPTHAGLPASHPSAAVTSYEPIQPVAQPAKPERPWLPWAIGAGALMLVLMAFGAGQALRSSSDDSSAAAEDGSEQGADPSRPAAEPPPADPAPGLAPMFDDDCSDGVCGCADTSTCDLTCGESCALRCTDVARCNLVVGDGSTVLCDRFGTCDIHCLGDCRVDCPQGGCQVDCPHPGDKHGRKRKKKPKKAKRCGDIYLCGRDCDELAEFEFQDD